MTALSLKDLQHGLLGCFSKFRPLSSIHTGAYCWRCSALSLAGPTSASSITMHGPVDCGRASSLTVCYSGEKNVSSWAAIMTNPLSSGCAPRNAGLYSYQRESGRGSLLQLLFCKHDFNRMGWGILGWQEMFNQMSEHNLSHIQQSCNWVVTSAVFTFRSSFHSQQSNIVRWAGTIILIFFKCCSLKFQVHCFNCYCLYYHQETEFFTLSRFLKTFP